MEGYIKIYRSIAEWEWHDDPNTGWLYVMLLVLANHEDGKWHGEVVKRGQLVTSLQRLSKITGISVQSIRTGLTRLHETGEVTSKSTNKYRIITICNYERYQDIKVITNKQATSNQQATNKQLTTNKNEKNKKESISKDMPKKENFFDEMEDAMKLWLEYKKEIRDAYKTERGIKACCANLRRLSGGSPERAMAIVNQSIANNWKGLFELKNDGKTRRPTEDERYGDAASLVAEKLARARGTNQVRNG